MTSDTYLWMSVSLVIASLAFSAVDVHESRSATIATAAPSTASPRAATPGQTASVAGLDAAHLPASGAPEPVAVTPASQRLSVAPTAAPDAPPPAGSRTTPNADAAPDAVDAETAGMARAADAGTRPADRAVAMIAAPEPEEPQEPGASAGHEALRTVALLSAARSTARVPRPASRWRSLIGHDVEAELRCLSMNIYWEARSEPALGRFAVAAVTLNRVGHKRFPDTVCGVVRQGATLGRHRCQFSWMCDGKSNTPRNAKAWREAEHIARSMLFLDLPDPTDGALWYHADYVSPGWAGTMARITQIGRHLFYRARSRQARGLAG